MTVIPILLLRERGGGAGSMNKEDDMKIVGKKTDVGGRTWWDKDRMP